MRPAFARAFCDEASVANGRLRQSCSRSWSSGVCAAGGVVHREPIPLVLHVVSVAIGVFRPLAGVEPGLADYLSRLASTMTG